MQSQPCITQLKEWADKFRCEQPTYACTAPAGQPSNWHCRAMLYVPQPSSATGLATFTADGAGRSKQDAKTAAAASLLMQLEQQGLRHTSGVQAGPAAASSSTQQHAPAPNTSCINYLADFLQAYGRGAYQVGYSDALRVPGTSAHRPQWTVDVMLLPFNGSRRSSNDRPPKLTASGSGPNRTAAKHAAAAALLLHPEFASLFEGDANAAAGLVKAAAAAQAAAVPVAQAAGAAAVASASPAQPETATAATVPAAVPPPPPAAAAVAAAAAAGVAVAPNYKSRLQELLQKAGSQKLMGWGGWQLPMYSTKRGYDEQYTMFTSTVTLQGPTGDFSISGTQPCTTKKEAEQHAAQLMLQHLQPDMQAQEQQGPAAAQQIPAGAAGLQAVVQTTEQPVQAVQQQQQHSSSSSSRGQRQYSKSLREQQGCRQ
ncbi:hypothetical protein COO60DRAFT_839019 [Scenedesmus sp. NREL 46B-D3]|nr:hypothetical protein COO60DRAFT_839019 [Scenedesmus sp. NREL 46B-D3]